MLRISKPGQQAQPKKPVASAPTQKPAVSGPTQKPVGGKPEVATQSKDETVPKEGSHDTVTPEDDPGDNPLAAALRAKRRDLKPTEVSWWSGVFESINVHTLHYHCLVAIPTLQNEKSIST